MAEGIKIDNMGVSIPHQCQWGHIGVPLVTPRPFRSFDAPRRTSLGKNKATDPHHHRYKRYTPVYQIPQGEPAPANPPISQIRQFPQSRNDMDYIGKVFALRAPCALLLL